MKTASSLIMKTGSSFEREIETEQVILTCSLEFINCQS